VALPTPEPGLVISLNYLWKREHEAGAEHGRYPRPCAIVVALFREAEGSNVVIVVPITTKSPGDEGAAIEIPTAVKRHLGLDADMRSWAIVDEVNEFVWPGVDLEPDAQGRIAYGFIPPKLHTMIRDRVLSALRSGKLRRTPR
jgi:hypothetical protein